MKKWVLLLIMVVFLIGIYIKWAQTINMNENEEEIVNMKQPEEQESQEEINDCYIEKPKEQEILEIKTNDETNQCYDWVKQYSQSFMTKFKIDHAHQNIFKTIQEYIVKNNIQQMDECDLIYVIFSQCHTISIAKKMEIAVYLIWKSKNQQQIDHVYEIILSIASDEDENPKTRANALEILMRSNNKIYIDRSKRIMDTLKEHEKIHEMEQIRQRMERIQNVMQQRSHVNPSSLRRLPPITPPQNLQGHVPLTQEELQVQNILLDQYRRLERRAFNAMKHKTTVYDDTQNVHNHKINESVIQSVENMMTNTPPPTTSIIQVEKELEIYYPKYEKHKEKIKNSLNRIRSDPSK